MIINFLTLAESIVKIYLSSLLLKSKKYKFFDICRIKIAIFWVEFWRLFGGLRLVGERRFFVWDKPNEAKSFYVGMLTHGFIFN